MTAPRITLADIEANIDSEYYFTAMDGALGSAWTDGSDAFERLIAETFDHGHPLQLLAFCVLILRNGCTVTGESACVSPENFDAVLGQKIARENAINKAWPLMGYALKQKLFESSASDS